MISFLGESRKAYRAFACGVLLVLQGACSQTLVDRVIDARGGPLESYDKAVDATVVAGMPGEWHWEVAYRVPESFRWTLPTLGEEQRLLFDGTVARHQLGGASLPPVGGDDGVLSQAHWFAVTSLDVLRDTRVSWRELALAELPPGESAGIRASFAGRPDTFELFFDERGLLSRARGRVALVPIGTGVLDARFSDYRSVDGYQLPFAGEYRLDGAPLMRERVRRWVPNDPALTPGVFSGQ